MTLSIHTPTLLLSRELPSLKYTSTPDRFDETWEAPLSTLLGLGRAAGADFIEFFLERVNYISCLAEEDTITSISPRLSTGAGVRVFKGQADCYVSTNDLSFSGLKAALEKGLSIMGLQLPAPSSFIPEINLELLRDYATKKGQRCLAGSNQLHAGNGGCSPEC
jgi:TldD protein